MTYPISFRHKVLSIQEKENLSIAQVAQRFCVGTASVTRWIKTPDPRTTRNKPATKIDMEILAQDIKNHPYAYQYERTNRPRVSACVIVMGSATFHKRQDIKTAFADAGHTLEYLPSYSPRFDDIEPKWAQAKVIRKRE
ncbi:transposase [Nitrosomonas communis]|uniref:Transposase n=1 Tax=Nitrosomonas communis TaxID=44574 RepID=A0A1I4U026_9PROT|nr:transposase [Nitrosomonas communis]SFM82384.1 Transposase [Nitrosomonas communis]